MSTTYFKCVQNKQGRLVSVCMNSAFDERYRVEYYPEQWVSPNFEKTKLFCFNDLKKAIQFVKYEFSPFYMKNIEILECEVENPQPVEFIGFPNLITKYWNAVNLQENGYIYLYGGQAPEGTIGCDKIKLGKLVKHFREEEHAD